MIYGYNNFIIIKDNQRIGLMISEIFNAQKDSYVFLKILKDINKATAKSIANFYDFYFYEDIFSLKSLLYCIRNKTIIRQTNFEIKYSFKDKTEVLTYNIDKQLLDVINTNTNIDKTIRYHNNKFKRYMHIRNTKEDKSYIILYSRKVNNKEIIKYDYDRRMFYILESSVGISVLDNKDVKIKISEENLETYEEDCINVFIY